MITKNQYSRITSSLGKLNYKSIEEVDFESFKEFDILCNDSKNIIITGKYIDYIDAKQIHWASNCINEMVKKLNELNGNLYLEFIPKQLVSLFEKNGFHIHSEWMDYFSYDIKKIDIKYDDEILFASKNDLSQLSRITKECQKQSRGFPVETIAWFEDWLNGEKNNIIIIKEGQNTVGYCCVSIYARGTTLWIRWIAVKPSYQGKGYGKRLIENALNYGINNGAVKSFLAVDKYNKKAINLYKKYDFKCNQESGQINIKREDRDY